MPERAINTRNATGFLLILLPAALAMSALFVAWPFILGLTVLVAGGNIWQNYEWTKMARSIEPSFQQLIVQNRGEITPIDLSLKANVPGKVATRYLVRKADEFGTSSRQYPDRGRVFYFISVSTLGNIFDDSELEATPAAIMPATASVVTTPVAPAQPVAIEIATAAPTPPTPLQITTPAPQPKTSVVEPPTSDLSGLAKLLDEQTISTPTPDVVEPATTKPATAPLETILQSDLAKRLDVHSSTVYKRRSEPNFTDWTRNRDPDGLAWGYAEDTKEYYQVDT